MRKNDMRLEEQKRKLVDKANCQVLDESHVEYQLLDYDEDSFQKEYKRRLKCAQNADLIAWLKRRLDCNAAFAFAWEKLGMLAKNGCPDAKEVLSRVQKNWQRPILTHSQTPIENERR